jgi:hypothetical protein
MKTFPSYDQLCDIYAKVANAITRKKVESVPNELTKEEMSIVRSLISGFNSVACDLIIDYNYSWSFKSPMHPMPDEYSDDEMYERIHSVTNKGVSNSVCSMRLVFRNVTQAGIFKILACSNGEPNHDYIRIYKLDSDNEIAESIMVAKDPSVASNYTPVNIYVPNDGYEHEVLIEYIKDGSVDKNDDCGYIIISSEGMNNIDGINYMDKDLG